jgi:histidinol-phosphate phosphatase family protein
MTPQPHRWKVVLLDRDGVLNQEPGPPLTPEEFLWIPQSPEAVARLKTAGMLVVVVTNQAAIARGRLTESGLQAISEKMQADLKQAGGSVDAIYHCPHHPDWDQGQRRSTPQPCSCRKPEPGLLVQAAADLHFSPEEAVLVGDKTSDFAAAERFGCPSVGVRTGHGGQDGTVTCEPLRWCPDLAEAVEWILST